MQEICHERVYNTDLAFDCIVADSVVVEADAGTKFGFWFEEEGEGALFDRAFFPSIFVLVATVRALVEIVFLTTNTAGQQVLPPRASFAPAQSANETLYTRVCRNTVHSTRQILLVHIMCRRRSSDYHSLTHSLSTLSCLSASRAPTRRTRLRVLFFFLSRAWVSLSLSSNASLSLSFS